MQLNPFKIFKKWLRQVFSKLWKHPIRNIPYFLVSLVLMVAIAFIIYTYLGLLTLVGYIVSCTLGLTKLIQKPSRTIVWAIGFALSAIAIYLFLTYFLPQTESKDYVSMISAGFILIIIIHVYRKSQKLKEY